MKPFEQQPGESAKAFAAFRAYRDAGAERSFRKVARKLNKSVTVLTRWSKKWNWPARLEAWAAHLSQLESEARDDAARKEAMKWAQREREFREQRYAVGQALIKKANDMLAFPLAQQITKDGKTIVNPAEWSMAQAARMTEVGEKLVAMSVGALTEKTAVEVSGPGGDPIPMESVAIVQLDDAHIDKLLTEHLLTNGNGNGHRSKGS